MSNQFYEYLSEKIVDFFDNNDINAGDRFSINLDNEEQVNALFNALKNTKDHELSNFNFDSTYGNYETFLLQFKDIKLVVVDSSITPDFRVTIRNRVSRNRDEWENTALLDISEKRKDSINDGMISLEERGYPLNLNYIIKNLDTEIENSTLKKIQKLLLKVYKDNLNESSLYKTTIWDFEPILDILNKGFVDDEDYNKLNLFYDSHLEKMTSSKKIENRIKTNMNIFSEIEDKSSSEEEKEKYLKKKFDDRGIEKLKKDNWKELDFDFVSKSMEEFNKKNETLKFEGVNIANDLDFWINPNSDKSAGKRTQNIIIFNPDNKNSISISFDFDKEINRTDLGKKNKKDCSISKNKLNINFSPNSDSTTFKRYILTHKGLNKNKFVFNILVLNEKFDIINQIKDFFILSPYGDIKIDEIHLKMENDNNYLELGSGTIYENNIKENEELILEGKQKIFIPDNWEKSFKFKINTGKSVLKFEIVNTSDKHDPLRFSHLVWTRKVNNKKDFKLEGNSLVQGNSKYSIGSDLTELLNFEKDIIEKNALSGSFDNGNLIKDELSLSPKLMSAYQNLFDYYNVNNKLPSLTLLNNELVEIYENILEIFNNEIEEIEDRDTILSNNAPKYYLNKVGVFEKDNKIFYSPISPLSLAYQLELYNQCYDEEIDSSISKRLTPNNLLPFIYKGDEIFSPTSAEVTKEWIVFDKDSDVSLGAINSFLKNIIEEKLKQFVTNFDYLFKYNSKTPLKINLINIDNDKKVVEGIFKFIANYIKEESDIIPLDINIYRFNREKSTSFEDFFKCRNENDLEEYGFEININSNLDALDVIRLVQENINYSVHNDNQFEENYEYAHISFYKPLSESQYSFLDMNKMDNGVSLNGLMSHPSIYFNNDEYRVGYGSNDADYGNHIHRLAFNLNELARNMENDGNNPYTKSQSIVSLYKTNEKLLQKIYDSSHWVNFIEPNFGLDYFANKEDLFIIHYSDQYSSVSMYDTITVTNKTQQYTSIINQFLESVDSQANPESISDIIRIFNSINGEWLLKLGLDQKIDKDKFNIISALKYILSIFNHEDIIWLPISMEDIVRKANNMDLDIKSKKLIGNKNGYSNNILLIGVNPSSKEIYYHPIEIKIGNDKNRNKYHIPETYAYLKELIEGNSFNNKFYRNFFIQLFISNYQNMVNNKIWEEKYNDKKMNEIKSDLLNDEYNMSFELEKNIGNGTILILDDDVEEGIKFENNSSLINLLQIRGYEALTMSFEEVYQKVSEDSKFSNKFFDNINFEEKRDNSVPSINETEEKDDGNSNEANLDNDGSKNNKGDNSNPNNGNEIIFDENGSFSTVSIQKVTNPNPPETDEPNPSTDSKKDKSKCDNLEDVRVLIGKDKETKNSIYWEFGNKGLDNRHMLIEGKSGQGKTYFIQKVINELSNQNIPTLIIDYTTGFTDNQLDNVFKENVSDKLETHVVYFDKFPLNPFKRYDVHINGRSAPQKTSDIAGRFKSIMNAVYNFGDQQLNLIYKLVSEGLEEVDEDFNLNNLKSRLKQSEAKNASSVLSKLSELFDNDPFVENKENSFDWSILDNSDGKVFIIQLDGYSRDIQKVITEIILWDLWYFKEQNGSKENPFFVVLDEAQNLNFDSSSPTYKILKEGRKNGWAACFATQSTTEFKKDELSSLNNVGEKIFFHPVDNAINSTVNIIDNDKSNKKRLEKTLSSLTKGECIVKGLNKNENGNLTHSYSTVKVDEIRNN